ncbi:unnamed protein product [Thelazia callipaeda]|uniref:Phosphodiesterase n=1 Tax=Thelazia callipaeda TaxID=103827 RepID=A0A0N5D059_THECL|nr:unnamed protein product [Thelazia callipaeda]
MDSKKERVVAYLDSHPKFLEDYVTGPSVTNEMFHRWWFKRMRKGSIKEVDEAWMADDLWRQQNLLISNGNNLVLILYELGHACAQLIRTETFDVLVYNEDNSFLIKRTASDVQLRKLAKHKRTPVYIKRIQDYSGVILGEIHFYRFVSDGDRTSINILCTWGTALIHYAQDIVSMDTVITKVMNFAQKLTNADRSSLFLVDHKTNELYARIFDVGTHHDDGVEINENSNKEIRFPANKGIGGYVATTGQVLNIENAYEDPRFNKEVDQKTGYRTRNILCMPIFIRKSVIGVVQMINKANGSFTKQDQNSFETFAVYCGLALHNAKLYERIKRSEQKYRVALEVLAYHSACNKDEVKKLKSVQVEGEIAELDRQITNFILHIYSSFAFNMLQLTELEKPLYAAYMFQTLFRGKINYEEDDLIRFVLTVRKNYRQVVYHNWTHGWSVAQAMFALLRATSIFTLEESLALYVAALCHDLDHRGKNNAYMKSMSTPLAAIYSTSVMEHHHFNQTVIILQQNGHNIFKSFSSDEYKKILGTIKHLILATDLAVFLSNKLKMEEIISYGTFNWDDNDHRLLIEAILMTGCDLIAAAKPWPVQTETVKIIFEEFYEQGDAERRNGQKPIAMMDRRKANEMPQMQVSFMQDICTPCYELIASIIPECQPLLDRCLSNTKKWQELAAEQKETTEFPEEED